MQNRLVAEFAGRLYNLEEPDGVLLGERSLKHHFSKVTSPQHTVMLPLPFPRTTTALWLGCRSCQASGFLGAIGQRNSQTACQNSSVILYRRNARSVAGLLCAMRVIVLSSSPNVQKRLATLSTRMTAEAESEKRRLFTRPYSRLCFCRLATWSDRSDKIWSKNSSRNGKPKRKHAPDRFVTRRQR